MGKSSKTQAPPDPAATAAAQTTTNKETAVAQSRLNAIDQYNPSGSVIYDEIPGSTVDGVPRYSVTTELSPENQQIYDQSAQNSLSLGNLAATGITNAQGVLGTQADLSDDAITRSLLDSYDSVYGGQWDGRRQELETSLINRGIRPGTAAYDQSVRGLAQARNDADNQLLLNGRNQALMQLTAERNQPLNEISALMSGSQVSSPSAGIVSTPQTGLAPTDVTGATYSSYNAALANNAQSNAAGQQALGGLFSLGAGALAGGYI